ncbi:hypothetical protein [Kyrpidia tusciae]|uniref:Antitoxin n=1 Tax=Kyrpidia tusciae (strain DSM 2912 / NBRC 15312 / T2) TaxID=562970 RepID=D5WUW9_KYRT2|nr:hypothetical protein [Kyrpidia tusciae]ADG07441.1 conserved hypothetical protein [Kyrpidia tusciae DSM 2912]
MGKRVTTDTLAFIQDHVLNVTDLVRTKKLSQILDSYADTKSTEIFIVQNEKRRNAKAVIVDLEYFEELLRYKEAVEQVMDEEMVRVAAERKDDVADIPLEQVIGDDFSFDEIKAEMDKIELDDEE